MQNHIYPHIQNSPQNLQVFQHDSGLNYQAMRSKSDEKRQSYNNNKESTNLCQASKFLGDHRYKNNKTPVQSAIAYLKSNGNGYCNNSEQMFRETQNCAHFNQSFEGYSQYDCQQMQIQANAQNYPQLYAQMYNHNSNFSPDYGFHQNSVENLAPTQMYANNQYFGNYHIPNQFGNRQYFQDNSYTTQNTKKTAQAHEYNMHSDQGYEQEPSSDSNEICKNIPEIASFPSNDEFNDN